MGECKYCGRDAGWFRQAHEECERAYEEASTEIGIVLYKALQGSIDLESAERTVRELAEAAHVSETTRNELALQAYESAAKSLVEDGLLAEDDEHRMVMFANQFGVDTDQLAVSPGHLGLVKAAVLRDIDSGVTKTRMTVDDDLPFNFQKSEKLIWLFQGCEYLQPRTRTRYEGRSSGVSVRIMKGVSYRVGQFAGTPVTSTELAVVDAGGALAVTDKHIYYAGQLKSVRVPYHKIVSFLRYSDGFAIQRDGIQKSDIFLVDDATFAYKLVTSLAEQASG